MSNYRSDDLERWAEMFKALSSPHRLQIFLQLACCCSQLDASEGQACLCVSEACQPVELAQSTLSHHLKELKHAGLIEMERDGRRIMCRVAAGAVRELETATRAICPAQCCG